MCTQVQVQVYCGTRYGPGLRVLQLTGMQVLLTSCCSNVVLEKHAANYSSIFPHDMVLVR